MEKIIRSDRPSKEESLPTKVVQLPYHDFNETPVMEANYFASDPAGHYFGVAAPEFMVPCSDEYKTVNIALTADLKGKKIRIEYLGSDEETKQALWEVTLVD